MKKAPEPRTSWVVRGQQLEILAIGMMLGLAIGVLGINFGSTGLYITFGFVIALLLYVLGYILGLDKALSFKITVPISFWSAGLGVGCFLTAWHLSKIT